MLNPSRKRIVVLLAGLLLSGLLVACRGGGRTGLASVAGTISAETLDTQNPTASHPDGISVTLVSGKSARVGLGSIPREIFLSGEEDDVVKMVRDSLPSYLEMKSPLYILEQRSGDEDAAFSVEILIPNDSQPYQTLDLYQWDEELGKWSFVAGHVDAATGKIVTDEFPDNVAVFQTKSMTPVFSTILEPSHALDEATATALNIVFPAGLEVQADGSLNGVLAPGWQTGVGYAVVPLIRADGMTASNLLNNEASLALHVQDLQAFTVGGGYNGVAIDYRDIAPADSDAFTGFIADLAAALDEQKKLLAVVLPQPSGGPGAWDTGGYDWRAVGAAADAVIILTGPDPRDFAIDGIAIQMMSWAVGEISRLKLHVAFSSLSVVKTNDVYELISYDDALAPFGEVVLKTEEPEGGYLPGAELTFDLDGDVLKPEPDQTTGAYTYKLTVPTGESRTWIVTPNVIRVRLDLLSAYNVGGMVINDLLADEINTGMMTVINEFKARSVSSVPSQLVIEWTVSDASGAILSENSGIGTPFVWKPAEKGKYTVQGQIVSGRVSDRGSVSVKVKKDQKEEASTPSPTTSASSGSKPSAETPAPTQAPPPPAGGAGGDSGALEYGGQVANSLAQAAQMKQAGMTWVKFQAKYPYVDAGMAGSFVESGHAAGFKVLISIPGPPYPQSIDFAAVTEHMRAVASYQPDAIEVWNEMNLDAEWPVGQIDPASYVNNMLAPAFNAIKSVSPNTMVILGALAPTGFDNGTNAWSDQRYLQGLAAAGAANYANCVGAHHNSGTTSPSVRSGRPEGDHYSWYFLPTVEGTYNSFGGTLPVCITEFGYLTPEGLGPLPQNFAWGGTNTVANQAAWLAEGIQISRSLGWVRLVIIWNVNFTKYDTDPQAGYAIIRPDGTCPACDALAGVAN